jgi:hypothetical protein
MDVWELINFDLADPRAAAARLEQFLRKIPLLPGEEKVRLTNALIDIIADKNQDLLARTQAVHILGTGPVDLGVRGSAHVARAIIGVLRAELHLPASGDALDAARIRSQISGMSHLYAAFIEGVVLAALSINVEESRSTLGFLIRVAGECRFSAYAAHCLALAEVTLGRGGYGEQSPR